MKIFNRPLPRRLELPLLFGVLYLPAYLSQGRGFPPGYFDSPWVHLQAVGTALLYGLLTLYLLQKEPPRELPAWSRARAGFRPKEFFLALAGLGGLYALLILLPGAWLVRQGRPPEPTILLTRPVMLIPAALTCLLSAAQEELFFRGYGYFRLRQEGASPFRAALFMALLFSAGHLYEGLPALVYALSAGLFLSRRLLRGASLATLAAAHGLWNFLVILLNYVSEGQTL